MTSKTFAYVRVSSKEQNIDRQIDTMRKLGIDDREIFIDKQSGKDIERPQYKLLKAVVRDGDTIVFDSITRLSRNMDDIKNEYSWFNDNGINLKFIKEPMLNTSNDTSDVMRKAINDIILTILGAFAQKEREEIKQRQKEGIEAARRRGKHLGRPKAQLTEKQVEQFNQLYPVWKKGEMTAVAMMRKMELKRNTFYNKVKLYEQLQIKKMN
ncbi:recombinase family protein [Rummeliibacillus sp. TYF005]|uniref:recombinase family protein n=1 Tax=Rummeliibacillus sp. TYF005 TaxID=2058214 RepID=UPI000F54C25E|nr:recombinase family protein [Rummeliibacillus sp. TYF005]RPJ97241.1 recombinase family protein [Rummeliibacillus sp. TYF005]